MLPLLDKMSEMTKAKPLIDLGRNDLIHHNTVYMQIVCFRFSFKNRKYTVKKGSIEYLRPSRLK